jgi:hypothetical protein
VFCATEPTAVQGDRAASSCPPRLPGFPPPPLPYLPSPGRWVTKRAWWKVVVAVGLPALWTPPPVYVVPKARQLVVLLLVVGRGSARGPSSMCLCKMSRSKGVRVGRVGMERARRGCREDGACCFYLLMRPRARGLSMFAVCEWASLLRSSPLGPLYLESGGSSFLCIVRCSVLVWLGVSSNPVIA